MIISNVGYNHCHDVDFIIERPEGSGDNLLLLIREDAIFTIDGQDMVVPKNSFFVYRKDRPQFYRCKPQCSFANDWVHFLFEKDEEERFYSLGLDYETPVKLEHPYFVNFCIRSVSNEAYSNHRHAQSNINHFMFLLFNHVSDQLSATAPPVHTNVYEMLCSVRNRIYNPDYHFYSVESSAHEIRMSKSNFQHLYKKYFGVSFMQDLINSRIERAKAFLLGSNLTSTEIAKQCGYSSFANFTRQFKARTGMTPLEFRKRFRENQE